jgi:CelD/BcsL family acetyltransferase involved in cellulose biosynthesis
VIARIENATPAQWDQLVAASETALYFQTREWFEIWAQYAGFESRTRLIEFASGNKVLLPLARRKLFGGLVRANFLAPKGMGGFVTRDQLSADEVQELFTVLRKLDMLCCVFSPFDGIGSQFSPVTGSDFTQVLDLGAGFDAIFSNWSAGHHLRANKGFRQEIDVEPAAGEADWRAYFDIYQDNLSRWGKAATNNYSWELFEIMCRKQSPNIKLWLARHQGQVISGALCFYHNRHVAYWHSATSQEYYKKLNATHVLQYQIIKDACDRGYELYDMLPSSGIAGVIEFKRGFSPREVPVHTYLSPLMQLCDALRNRLRGSALYRTAMKNTGF